MASLVSQSKSEKIADILDDHTSTLVSIEFFPPKTEVGIESLFQVLNKLKAHKPVFVDFTWGAGGSTSDLTLDLCRKTRNEYECNPNMHLTCTNMETSKIDSALEGCKESGIVNIFALRGDPPAGQDRWTATEEGLTCALDLVRYIRRKYDDYFCIGVAGYPEGHPNKMSVVEGGVAALSPSESTRYNIDVDEDGSQTVYVCNDADFEEELTYLKEKVDAGGSFIITQMFFDPEVFGIFVSACRAKGIRCPILPGIMCISNYGGFKRMTKFCKSRVPPEVAEGLEATKDSEDGVKEFGVAFGTKMCNRLVELGAPGLHFYTLNSSVLTHKILENLKLGSAHSPEAAVNPQPPSTVFPGIIAAAIAEVEASAAN